MTTSMNEKKRIPTKSSHSQNTRRGSQHSGRKLSLVFFVGCWSIRKHVKQEENYRCTVFEALKVVIPDRSHIRRLTNIVVVRNRRSTDYEVLKCWKGRSGSSKEITCTYRVKLQRTQMPPQVILNYRMSRPIISRFLSRSTFLRYIKSN